MKRQPRQVWLFVLPFLAGFLFLTLVPMAASLALSFVRTDGNLSLEAVTWVGLEHYRDALEVDGTAALTESDPWYFGVLGGRPADARFYRALYNSLVFTVFTVSLGLCVSLAVALLLNRRARGMSVVRTIVYLPHVLGGVAAVMIWSWLFNPRFGWINQCLRLVYDGLDPLVMWMTGNGTGDWPVPAWLHSPLWCKPAVIIMSIWTMGPAMLVFLAAIRRVPPDLHQAARLDGAGAWARFRSITLPQITPAILFNLVFSCIFSMQAFNESYLLQNSSQRDGLLFYVRYIYETAFESPYRIGYGSALAWILFAILLVVILPLVWTSRKWVHDALSEGSR